LSSFRFGSFFPMFSFAYRFFVVAASFGVATAQATIAIERSVGSARISLVAQTSIADLVILDNGHDAGLRQGMVCVATRNGDLIGELLLVDLRPRTASALILDLYSDAALRPGDLVAVKTVSSRK
jgi:hypothetical protein